MIKKCTEAKIFLIVTLICGLLLAFLIPPLQAADEPVHFINAYAVSRGHFFGHNADNIYFGHDVPEAIYNYSVNYPWGIFNDTNAKFSYSRMIGESINAADIGTNVTRKDAAVPTGYMAAAIGMAVGNVIGNILFDPAINAQPFNQMVYGRLGNLFFYVFITYLAICITPRFKKSMLLVATMPMSLFLAASLSYDPLVISVCFLFFAIILYMMKTGDKVITRLEIAVVLFCTFFLVGAKQAYAPLLLLLLGIPKTKYGSIKKLIGCIVAVCGAAVIGYLPVLINNSRTTGVAGDPAISAAIVEQRNWVSAHVGETAQAILNTLSVKRQFYTESFWGKLGWLDTPFPIPMMMLGYTALLLTGLAEIFEWQPKEYGQFWKRLLPVAGVLISFVGIELAMYIYHTPRPDVTGIIGGSFVEGGQGRYFIPFFIPILMVFSNGLIYRIYRKSEKESVKRGFSRTHKYISYLAGSGAIMCGVYTVTIVLLRYWI